MGERKLERMIVRANYDLTLKMKQIVQIWKRNREYEVVGERQLERVREREG